MTKPNYTAVYETATADYTIKKSRFIASLAPVTTDTEAMAFVESIRKQYWDARHNCYAYQIGPSGQLQKSNDDGEPSGTAGRPMLEILKKANITNTVVVVTRYFGGIKLGASGLIRAYSHAVSLGLEAAAIADYIPFAVVQTTFAYPYVSLMERTAPDYDITITDRQFLDTVTFTLHVPVDTVENWKSDWTNATNGTATYADEGTVEIPVLRKKEATL